MSIVFVIFVIVIIAVLFLLAIDQIALFAPYNGLLKAIVLVGAALLIAEKAGVF